MCTAQTYANSACQSINPDEVLECRFRHYFTTQTQPVIDWFKQFRQEVYKLLASLGLTEDETEYLLRSYRFVTFARDLQGLEQPQLPTAFVYHDENGDNL